MVIFIINNTLFETYDFLLLQVAIMDIYKIRVIAKNMSIEPKKMNKAQLIKSIQIKEGNSPCFKKAGNHCDQADCLWKNDCLK